MTEQTLRVDAIDQDHLAVVVELSLRRDTVEVRCRNKLAGIADRDTLRSWLRDPQGIYEYDDMAWLWNGYAVGVCIRNMLPTNLLRPHVVENLRMFL
jgi:hypothetical protein